VSESVLVERRGAATWITLNRPDRRNALNDDVVDQIGAAVRDASVDSNCRVIVLTGAGDKAFCVGGDLKPDSAAFEQDWAKPGTHAADMLRAVRAATTPIVARINGDCLAGGMLLLGMCDLAVGVDSARFGLPEVRVGLFPMQVLAVLQHRVPQCKLAEWSLTGELFDAAEAKAAGMLNYVVPAAELDAKVDWLVARLIDKSPTAQRRGKYALRAVEDMSAEQAIAYLESQITTLALTEDAREGRAAFAEKRKPEWRGK
jgi:enoyl-CoA hydratase/carnithine racemase